MTWHVLSASEIGTSHVASGGRCDDSCWAQVEVTPAGKDVLSLFVADGAGSAEMGGRGAELAIQAAADFLGTQLSRPESLISYEFAAGCLTSIRERLATTADSEGRELRAYATTFLGVVSCEAGTLVMQLGDGAVALDVGNGLEVPITPMSGEYANMTCFVTDENAVGELVARAFPVAASRVAVFTDGIQRIAMNLATNTPHEPFFKPFFSALAECTPDREDELNAALTRFLKSSSVNERTDDDKTLALAVRVP